MPKSTRRVVLTFPSEEVEKPVVYRLVKEFDLVPNILKAAISPNDVGTMVIELSGDPAKLESAMEFLGGLGVTVEPLSQDILFNEARCIHCGACVTFCPSGALRIADASRRIEFVADRCTACGFCLRACPTCAMEGKF